MLVTAHGGALYTHRNSVQFFEKIKDYSVDIIEVDIWKCGKLLYLSHMPSVFPFMRKTLSYAFDYIKTHDFRINCDVKQRHLVKPVVELAKQKGVLERIIFTGSVCRDDILDLQGAEVYLNKSFFGLKSPKASDVKGMKSLVDSFNCSSIKGINLRYTFCTEDFLDQCRRLALPVSVFVVDKQYEMIRLTKRTELANITTNHPDTILNMLGRDIKKR